MSNRTILWTLMTTGLLAATGVACSGENVDSSEIVRVRVASVDECADGGQTVLVGIDNNADGKLEGAEIVSTSPICNGAIGETGPNGIPGTNALIVTAAEAAGANCSDGGVRLDVGIDDDRDGTLQAGEIDSTSYVCNGVRGADGVASLTRTSTNTGAACSGGGVLVETGVDTNGSGTLDEAEITSSNAVCNGRDGSVSLVAVTTEPAGANCVAGGQRIQSGLDDNGDGTLTGVEIADTSYICNPINNLVQVSPEIAGTSTVCANGGSRVQVGLDTNSNGTLDAPEVTQTTYSCNGADGPASLVTVNPELAGANCVNGGQRVDAGADDNGNGTLDVGEVDTTSYVCNGANGQNGSNGMDGTAGSLVRVSAEVAGANCVNGGTRIESGPDTNGNGVLDGGEITATSFACDGDARESLVISTAIASGPQCANGGFRVDSGLDTNGNTVLDAPEITSTSFVCNGLAAVPFAIQTAMLPPGIADQPYSTTLTAAGGTGGSYTWSISAGALPPGLTLDPTGTPDANLSGLPTGGGNFTFTVQVTDFFGQATSRQFTLAVAGPVLSITTFVVPTVVAGTPYTFTMMASGGAAPYSWSLVQGTLPAGLSINTSGVISGTPTVNQQVDVLLQVADSSGTRRSARIVFPNRHNWASFVSDGTTDTVNEIYVANLSTGTPGTTAAINPTPSGAGSIGSDTTPTYTDAKFTLSGDKVAFTGDFNIVDSEELWFVDLTGATAGAPVRANTPFTASTQDVDTDDYRWSPDGRWLAYIADEVNDAESNLYVVDTNAAVPTSMQVNATLPSGSDVDTADGIRFSPDSTKIAYISDEETAAVETLYVVDLNVTPFVPQRVSLGSSFADVSQFFWTPDGTSLIYISDDLTDAVTEAFISNVSGATPTAPVRINEPFANASGDIGTGVARDFPTDIGVSPDGTMAFYIADARTESVDELFVVDLANPGVARLVSHDGRTNTSDDVDRAFWTPDSQSLVFVADTVTTDELEIFLGDASGLTATGPVTLNAPFVSAGDVVQGTVSTTSEEIVVDPRNRGVFFMADAYVDTEETLIYCSFSAPGTMQNLAPEIGSTEDVTSFLVSDGGGLVVWNGDPTGSAIDELYGVDTSGATFGMAFRINGVLPTNGDVDSSVGSTSRDYEIFGDGEAVMYIADELVDGVDQPFWVPISGGAAGTPVPLLTPVSGGLVFNLYR